MIFYCLLLLLCLCAAQRRALTADDFRVHDLPGVEGGFSKLPYAMYAGYIDVTPTFNGSRQIYFWFFESVSPSNELIWITSGGPGCAGTGFFGLQEVGPLRAVPQMRNDGVYLRDNPLSVNRYANVIFVDFPEGVGSSLLLPPWIWTSDNQSAETGFTFLSRWRSIFSDFATMRLTILTESYGGVYGPMLAYRILSGDDAGLRAQLSAGGLMLGNPVIDVPQFGIISRPSALMVPLWFYHGMVSYELYTRFVAAECDEAVSLNETLCDALLVEATQAAGPINGDNRFSVTCAGNASLEINAAVKGCLGPDSVAVEFLNDRSVRKALHISPLAAAYTDCTSTINYYPTSESMLPFVQYVMQNAPKMRVLFYSGDVDIATVPTVFTQVGLSQLEPTPQVVSAWRPYYVPQNPRDPAGYVEVYQNYTFATVKGGGHEVPFYQPLTSYYVFRNFILYGTVD